MFGSVRANVGFRARLGFMVLGPNTIVEEWLSGIRIEGVTHHVGRMPLVDTSRSRDMLAAAEDHIATARLLAQCEPDVIGYACTALSFLGGRTFDLALMDRVRAETGLPLITTTEAILRALDKLAATKICIASPYDAEIDAQQIAFFEASGLSVVNCAGFRISDYREIGDPTPGEIYRLGRQAWHPEAEALVITCLALRGHYVAEQLEEDLGIPVVTSSTALLWACLREAGVNAPIGGFGRLLGMPC